MNAKTCQTITGAAGPLALTHRGKGDCLVSKVVSVTQYIPVVRTILELVAVPASRRLLPITECYCCSSHHLVPGFQPGAPRTLTAFTSILLSQSVYTYDDF